MPKISVIIPIYNTEEYLEQCLTSVLNQTLIDIEIILIDDGSTDTSNEICSKYALSDKRIKILRQQNSGPGRARNLGICHATGKYLMFLDSDDFFEKNLLEVLYKKSEETKSEVTVARFWQFNEISQLDEKVDWDINLSLLEFPYTFSPQKYTEKIFQLFNTAPWFSLYKASFISKYNIKFSTWIRSEDNLFTMSALALANKISVVNKRLIHYRVKRQNSLGDAIYNNWENTFKAFISTKKFLEANSIFQEYKHSFINCMLDQINYYLLEQAKYPVKSFIQHEIVKTTIPSFNLLDYDKKSFDTEKNKILLDHLIYKKNYSNLLENYFYTNINKICPIFYTINKTMIKNLLVSIESIKKTMNKKYFYDIYILHEDISSEWQNNLETYSSQNLRITTIDVNKFHSNNQFCKAPYEFLSFIDTLFDSYSTALYIPSNMILKSDISTLLSKKSKNILLKVINSSIKSQSEDQRLQNNLIIINMELWKKLSIGRQLRQFLYLNKTEILENKNIFDFIFHNYSYFINKKNDLEKFRFLSYSEVDLMSNIGILAEWIKLAKCSPYFESILHNQNF